MARKTVTLRANADGTYTVRVGRYVEHLSGDKTKAELWDAARYAAITAGLNVHADTLTELLMGEVRRASERSGR